MVLTRFCRLHSHEAQLVAAISVTSQNNRRRRHAVQLLTFFIFFAVYFLFQFSYSSSLQYLIIAGQHGVLCMVENRVRLAALLSHVGGLWRRAAGCSEPTTRVLRPCVFTVTIVVCFFPRYSNTSILLSDVAGVVRQVRCATAGPAAALGVSFVTFTLTAYASTSIAAGFRQIASPTRCWLRLFFTSDSGSDSRR